MSSSNLPLRSRGIYHNLPTFPPLTSPLTAIVTGANGISGFHAMRVLLESPERWGKIYALSRRQPSPEMMALLPSEATSRVEHIASDFMLDSREIAQKIKDRGVEKVDAIFFYSYFQPAPGEGATAWSNAEELVRVNTTLLRNFLSALDHASLHPARIVLQTGAKNYGIHLGPLKSPIVESDPRVTIEPNFYYPQEDILFDYCKKHSGTSWNVLRPSWVIGAVNNAQMNPLYPLAVYAAVQAHLGRKLDFGGDLPAWMGEQALSTAMLTGYLAEWVVLEDKCKNEAFNANDTGIFAWGGFWPELARWYGVKEVGRPEVNESKLKVSEMPYQPPIGFGPPALLRYSFTLSGWAADPENQRAWKEIMAKYSLTQNPFEDIEANFTFGDVAIWMMQKRSLSMNKARLLGWNGFVDTTEAVFEAFSEMSKLGMLPPPVVDSARPSV